ncbi:MAG: hypothetical protein UU93_C0005G0051 [Candidatus Amesbacteria bacterium GW2011_GWA2_42_12]|uniref:DUF5673 domain-containing protein n=1 Tax=Candidatus Amesbacteria bacterium GW2011_GWA2_42_12 TaxID=1618356 RepID=A0A0G1B5D4_9BACT|nr:MAG: hypothetical protein UU93_C0005G0051 [Candidatus Amesbacteria bacterium GW2011_GWA2_42_12]
MDPNPAPTKRGVLQEQEILKWIAPGRPYKTRDRQFFMTMMVIAILVSILLMFAGEWMLVAVIVAMVFAYYVWSTVPPEEVEHVLTTRGIRVYSQLYRFEDMDRWWIEDKWGHKILMIDAPMLFPKRLHLVLTNVDEKAVTEALGEYVLMEKPIETSIDKMGNWLSERFPLETKS